MIEDRALVLDRLLRELIADSRIPLPDLCDKLRIERHAFQELIRKETGISFRCLRQHVCMQLAAAQLRDSAVSVKEVAYGLGYRCPRNFTRAFSRFAGANPTEFRMSARNPLVAKALSLNETSFSLIPSPDLPYLRAIVSRSPESRL